MVTAAMLPPAGRDFEIHRLHRVEHVSTYALAERFEISQTRVRQIVQRVGQWLASMLPEQSDREREQEQRLAQCLAADQLQSQLEKLQVFWEQTRDPKFLRQQTRVVLALARLGVVPGAIDGVAAEAEERRVGVSPARVEIHGAVDSDKQQPGRPEAYPTNPPARDCLCAASHESKDAAGCFHADGVSSQLPASSGNLGDAHPADLEALQLIERRLLALLDSTPPADQAGREGLETTLANVRRNRAAIEVRVSPASPGVEIDDLAGRSMGTMGLQASNG